MAYENFKDVPKRTAFDEVFRDKAFNFAKNSIYNGYEHGLDL